MKHWTVAVLAALLLVSLVACQKTPEEPAEPSEPPTLTEPDTPISSTDPIVPPEAPEEPKEDPVAPPESEEEEEPLQLFLYHPGTGETILSESGEEAVSLYPTELIMKTGVTQADEAMNAYYKNIFDKLKDFCTGELMELSEDGRFHYSVTVDADLARYDPIQSSARRVLSVARTVTVHGDDTGLHTVTYWGETFDCVTGGLLTADDFFTVPESEYIQRLAECVQRQISEDPYHDQNYFAQWEDLTVGALEKENFYVTEDAYVVFYQENQLGPSAAVFPIPWSQLEDIAA